AFFPLGEWLLYPLETRFPANPELPQQVDGIIVLSGAEDAVKSAHWDQVEMGDGAERNLAFFNLARRYPSAKLVFTGGSGSLIDQTHKGADVAKSLFQNLGLDTSKIIFERESRNTYENAIYSKKMVTPGAKENWILITTAWHMPRSMGIFTKAGWPMIPYPVDHQTLPDNLFRVGLNFAPHLASVKTAVKEWMGLTAYYLAGRTSTLFPGSQPKPLPATP
ncbi:MAG: YdcF family protein, partial [Desulfobulbaceae bacterium]|nr:YdcF family protein [Desulfobulbaceae bacterium]